MRQMLKIASVAALVALSACELAPSGKVVVSDAWARETTPGAAVSAGYARIHNGTGGVVRLVGADTPAVGRIEIHTISEDGGIVRMRPLKNGLKIPSGESVELKPVPVT